MITTFRIIWGRPGDIPRGMTCLTLPLHLVIFIEEESPSSFSFKKSRKIVLHLSEPLPGITFQKDDIFKRLITFFKGQNPGPVSSSQFNFIKLSFKEGFSSDFIGKLSDTIQSRLWEANSPTTSITPGPGPGPSIKLRAGIVGIERSLQEKHRQTDESITKAFQDLSKLMTMAKDMVGLSRAISNKIRDRQGDITEDETVRFKSYLMSLGIDDPVTRDSYRSNNKYFKDLARQISDIVLGPVSDVGGMMALTDVFCRVNRARGLELLSPEDLLNACRLMDNLQLPLKLHEFETGVKVLQLQTLSDENVANTTLDMVSVFFSNKMHVCLEMLGLFIIWESREV